MKAQPKPNSSYASNRLTRRNAPSRHLLSSFNKPRDDDLVKAEATPTRQPREPGTDDEPLSSSENEPSDADEARSSGNEKNKKALGGKGRDVSTSPISVSGQLGSQSQSSSARKGGLRRTLSMLTEDDDDGEDPFSLSFPSQSSKRMKMTTYASGSSFSRAPSSSARSPATPDKRPLKPNKSDASSKKSKGRDKKLDKSSDSEPGVAFKMPIEINAPSPRKPRATRKSRDNSAKFKMPPTFFNVDNSTSSLGTLSSKDIQTMIFDSDSPLSSLSTPLSSPSSSIFGDSEAEHDRQPSPPAKALCPMCKAEVDPELLLLFEAQPKQRIREQQQFCASHQQNTAEKEWAAQGYPVIDWSTFDERVQTHFSSLEKLLVAGGSSYYRNILDSDLKSGKAKNFRLTLAGDGLETISCGYYGTKGSQKMLQAVMDRFATRLRHLSRDDKIITTAGVAGYAQSVLVPELAMRLVKEDMGVDDHAAREILRDSIDIGQKMHPAQDDVVPVSEDDEEVDVQA